MLRQKGNGKKIFVFKVGCTAFMHNIITDSSLNPIVICECGCVINDARCRMNEYTVLRNKLSGF